MTDSIREWLIGLDLAQYADAFEANDLDLTLAIDLSDADLKELGVASMGHRKKLIRAIEALTNAPAAGPQTAVSAPDATASPQQSPVGMGQAERRQLTVMFSDLVGSTAMSQRLDPEDLREVMRHYQDTIGSVVERYGGVVAKFLGDGALAYFGWPQAHEDQAERALRAGLDVVAAVQDIGVPGDEHLAARVGIATGQVVIGDIVGESAREDDAVIGDTPNLAARLQEFAEPGQLVVDGATRRLVGATYEFAELGPRSLKGFSGRVPVWQVLREQNLESRFEAAHERGLARFVGRRSELGLMSELWQQAVAGDGQALLLSGEAGIGKSRLVRAFEQSLDEASFIRLHHQCSPFHVNSALHPIAQHLEHAARISTDDSTDQKLEKLEHLFLADREGEAETMSLIAALLSLPFEERYGASSLAPAQRKSRTLGFLMDRLLTLSRERPVLCLFEDVHWVDPTTLEMLEQTIPTIADASVFLVVTHRPEWNTSWRERFSNVASLPLNRLSRALVTELVQTIAGETVATAIVGDIVARTDGIPLFVEEVTKATVEAAGLAENGGPAVPETIQTSLLARLDRLGAAKELAQVGAVIGRQFEHRTLETVVQMGEEALNNALSQLVSSELVYQRGNPPDAHYTFKHALVQDTAYSSLLRSERRRLHGRIASVLVQGPEGLTSIEPEVIAQHFTEAGNFEPAIEYWTKAGHRAVERSANIEAAAHFGKALTLLDELPNDAGSPRRELNLRAHLGVPLSATKGPASTETFENYERARLLCAEIGDTPELYQVTWGCWRANLGIGRLGEARGLADELLSLAESKRDESLLLEAHHAQWTTLSRVNEPLSCWKQAEQGLSLYDVDLHHHHVYTITDHDAGVCCRCFGALSLWQLGYPERALRLMGDARSLAEKLSHPTSMAHALSHSTWLFQARKDYASVLEYTAMIEAFAVQHGFAQYLATGSILKGWALTCMGKGEEGLEHVKRGIASGEAKGTGQSHAYFLHLLADAHLQLHQPDEGLAAIHSALEDIDHTGLSAFEPEVHRIHGALLRQSNNIGDAETQFTRAIDQARAGGARMLELRATIDLARLWSNQGRRSDALDILTPAYDWFDEGFETPDLEEARATIDELT